MGLTDVLWTVFCNEQDRISGNYNDDETLLNSVNFHTWERNRSEKRKGQIMVSFFFFTAYQSAAQIKFYLKLK